MRKYVENYTAFIGSKDIIEHIYNAIDFDEATEEERFNFQALYPESATEPDTHWGTPPVGDNAIVMYKSPNLLLVAYETVNTSTKQFLDKLHIDHPSLHIVNGCISDDTGGAVTITHGTPPSFNAYFHVIRNAVSYRNIVMAKDGHEYDTKSLWMNLETVEPNIETINALLADNCLVTPSGEIIDIAELA